jgi:hypothetical protein
MPGAELRGQLDFYDIIRLEWYHTDRVMVPN